MDNVATATVAAEIDHTQIIAAPQDSKPVTSHQKSKHHGWEYETVVKLSDDYTLDITTRKSSSGALYTSARCDIVKDGWRTHRMYQDFNITLKVSKPARITQKVCEDQHTQVIGDIINIIQQAKKHNTTIPPYKGPGEN